MTFPALPFHPKHDPQNKTHHFYFFFLNPQPEREIQIHIRSDPKCRGKPDEHLMCDIEGQHLTAAAITGLDGAVWAQSSTFPEAKPNEINLILKDFDEPGTLAPTGLHLGGAKYMVIQGEPGAVIRGKKGTGGITIKKTGQALIFGIYEEPMTPGQCNLVVERLGDYLVEQGM